MEGKDNFRGNDKHEIAAFMKMFMDMVGISEHDSIPSGNNFYYFFLRFTSNLMSLFSCCNDLWNDVWTTSKSYG